MLGTAAATASLWTPGAFAAELTRTPLQTEGPFYPDKLPLDTDNDLIIVNESITPAVGEITHLAGRILDAKGEPLRNATVEIWQVDNNAIYLHTQGGDRQKRDSNFQGYGRFLTGENGDYYFRTIKPVAYVSTKGMKKFTTQCYVKGHPKNEADGVLREVRDPKQREMIIVDFAPVKESKIGELAAKFDVVLGFTPQA